MWCRMNAGCVNGELHIVLCYGSEWKGFDDALYGFDS